ncbi:MAG: DUF4142 domain-containing protein [Gemmatimonadaceae bacterium]
MQGTLIAVAATTISMSLVLAATSAGQTAESMPTVAANAELAAELDDATIIAIFDAANTADIETGELAMQRGESKEVRDFGAMLARDHQNVRQQGRDLARRLGVTPTPPAGDAHAKAHELAMAELRSLHGTEFDHAFLQHEVAFHKAVLDAVKTTLLPAIRNAEIRDLVVKVAPAFQAHMMAAESLDRRLYGASK